MGEIEDPIHHQKIPQNVVPLKVLAIDNIASNPPENTSGSSVSSSGNAPTVSADQNPPTQSNEDRVRNYALQYMQLGVMLMQLNDTEKEGDGERCLESGNF